VISGSGRVRALTWGPFTTRGLVFRPTPVFMRLVCRPTRVFFHLAQVDDFEDSRSGYSIKFTFTDNPYFANRTVIKEYHMPWHGKLITVTIRSLSFSQTCTGIKIFASGYNWNWSIPKKSNPIRSGVISIICSIAATRPNVLKYSKLRQ